MHSFKKLLLIATLIAPLHFASGQAQIVINEVYGGGGNAGAPFNQDFVELFNNGVTSVNIGGWVLQYGSATGSFTTFATVPSMTTLAPGAFYLVSAGPVGTIGSALPTPNLVGATGTNIGATAGKVQLLNASIAIVDLVGYGTTANMFEGVGPAPAGSNTLSINRTGGIDTNNNNVDFTTAPPSPTAMVPEPTTYLFIGMGLLICAQQFRRRRALSGR